MYLQFLHRVKVLRWTVVCTLAALSPLDGADLNGTARDPQGSVVLGARITLQSATTIRTATTDSGGGFRFTGLPAGSYQLEAYSPGFERRTVAVRLEESGEEIEVTLEPAGLYEGIVVTASRQETDTVRLPLPTSLVSDQKLREQMPTNLAQGLFELPGVAWVNAGAFRSRPVIRGLDSNRILVLVDGERLNNNRTSTGQGGIETSLVDLSDIQQVEVVRGPGSVMYGSDAFGGVVNIRTRAAQPSDHFRVGVRLGASAYPNSDGLRGNAELSASNRWFGARARGSVGAIDDYHAPGTRVYGTGADENSALGELRVYPGADQTLSFKFLHRGGYNFGLPGLDPDPIFLAIFPFSKLTKYSGGYRKDFSSAWLSSIRANVYSQNQNRDFFNSINIGGGARILSETVTDVDSSGFDLQATSLPSLKHVLTYGATYYRDGNRDHRLQTMVGAGPAPITLDDAPSVPNSTFSGTGLFLQDQFEPVSRVRLTGGLRFDRFVIKASPTPNFDPDVAAAIAERDTDSAVSGNIGASIDLGAGWIVSGNLGRAFRAPNLFERYFFGRGSVGGFIVPNPALKPETSLQLDTGLHFRSGPVKASVNYFLNHLNDLISSSAGTFHGSPTLGDQPVFQNINIEKARIQGIEASTEFVANGWAAEWRPVFSVAWQRGSNRVSGAPLPLIAPFIGQARLRWSPRRSRLWSDFGTTLVTGSDRVPPGFTPIRGFATFSWRAGYELVRGEYGLGARLPAGISSISFHAGLENLGNRTYFGLFETVPQPGRDFRIGIDLSFDSSAK